MSSRLRPSGPVVVSSESWELHFFDRAPSVQCAQALAAEHGLAAEVVGHLGYRNAHVFLDLRQPAASVEPVPSGFVVLPKR